MHIPPLQQLRDEVAALEHQLVAPQIIKNPEKLRELSRALSEKRELLKAVSRHEHLVREQSELQEMTELKSSDLAELARDDLSRVQQELATLTGHIEELLAPKDPMDGRDVILELRAGTGGEEAALFACELFRAYTRYGELHGWKVHVVSSSIGEHGGLKEVIAEVSGRAVFGTLKYERGVHRVQRVPVTERQGRIHTSTITVAVLPQAEEVDVTVKPQDLRIDTYRASGAGGQHVNKTSSAVRITHVPSGTVVAVQDERSQHKNKDKAMRILRARLLETQARARQKEEVAERRAQIGTGERSEKIRTYNFPQDRVTDHRIKHSWGNLLAILDGKLDEIFQTLQDTDRRMVLENALRTIQGTH